MKLHYVKIPSENPQNRFVILHGLFGSGKNWTSVGNALAKHGTVWLLDSRNHGDSDHDQSHTLDDLADDLAEFLAEHKIINPVIIGHSMGGLSAMHYALKYQPDNTYLVVVDIFPENIRMGHENEIRSLMTDVSRATSRQEIDRQMAEYVPDRFIRQFLQMNLERTNDGYRWKINVDALKNREMKFAGYFDRDVSYNGKTLFVMGGASPYYRKELEAEARRLFTNSDIEVIPDGTHYLHYASFEEFMRILEGFIPPWVGE